MEGGNQQAPVREGILGNGKIIDNMASMKKIVGITLLEGVTCPASSSSRGSMISFRAGGEKPRIIVLLIILVVIGSTSQPREGGGKGTSFTEESHSV